MAFVEELRSQLGNAEACVAALGTFDGVHIGHRRLLKTAKATARERNLRSVAIAFRRQPRSVIRPDVTQAYLASLPMRRQILEEQGLDSVVFIDFDESVRMLSASQFLGRLASVAGVKVLVLGPGARLGHDRAGIRELAADAAGTGVEVIEVPAETREGEVVSSSSIRNALERGNVESASMMLGRSYVLDGTVEHGDHRGRQLGYPTANIVPVEGLTVPGDGIYATRLWCDGEGRDAATSIGVRPTFNGHGRRIEAYVLDFSGDLYGKPVGLEFVKRLRGELKFDSPGLLIEQMKKDVEETRVALSGAK